jgi:hypothetical protein
MECETTPPEWRGGSTKPQNDAPFCAKACCLHAHSMSTAVAPCRNSRRLISPFPLECGFQPSACGRPESATRQQFDLFVDRHSPERALEEPLLAPVEKLSPLEPALPGRAALPLLATEARRRSTSLRPRRCRRVRRKLPQVSLLWRRDPQSARRCPEIGTLMRETLTPAA